MTKTQQTLPPYFPLKVKKCAIVADAFFTCFDSNFTGESPNSGFDALETCSAQLKAYKDCMQIHYVATRLNKTAKSSWWPF